MSAPMTEDEMVRAYMRQIGCDRATAVKQLQRAAFPFAQAAPVVTPTETVRQQMTRALRDVFSAPVLAAFDNLQPVADVRLYADFHQLVTDGMKFGVINGQLINTKRYRQAKKALRALFASQWPAGRGPFECPVAVDAWLSFPLDAKRRDVTNYSKLAHDALTSVAYLDDSQIHDSRWRRAPDSESPLLEITITPLQGQ